MNKVDLSKYKNFFSIKTQILRMLWYLSWLFLARPLPRNFCNWWKVFLIRAFGGKIHSTSKIYSTVKIYMPWNLEMHEYSCLAPGVDCYNVAKITIGAHSTVSQKSFLCSASHDVTKSNTPLIYSPITLEDQVWIGSSAFIGRGVTIGQGAVVGATASVYNDVKPWTIVGGNPSKFLKNRVIND